MIVFEGRNAILEDCETGAHSLFQTWPFLTKNGEIGAHSFLENWPFSTLASISAVSKIAFLSSKTVINRVTSRVTL